MISMHQPATPHFKKLQKNSLISRFLFMLLSLRESENSIQYLSQMQKVPLI